MSEIPAEHLPIIAYRFRTFDDPRMSRDKLVELVHGYAAFSTCERRLSKWPRAHRATPILPAGRQARRGLKVSRRLITVEMVL